MILHAPRASSSQGFTLVVTITILAAVTLLVVGIFVTATTEKQVSASFDAVEQADLAVKAGLARASGLLDEATKREDGIIFSKPLNPAVDANGRTREYLVAASFDSSTNKWRYYPLLSGAKEPMLATPQPTPPTKLLMDLDRDGKADTPEPLVELTEEETKSLEALPRTLPWKSHPLAYWENLTLPEMSKDGTATEVIASRFCFSIEDLQAGVSLRDVGNTTGQETDGGGAPSDVHERLTFQQARDKQVPFIPGLNTIGAPFSKYPLDQVALYTIPFPAADKDTPDIKLDNWLVKSRGLEVSPGAWREVLMAEGQKPEDFVRGQDGLLAGAEVRRLEMATAADVQEYDELALIPPVSGCFRDPGPNLKMNLNKVLKDIEDTPGVRSAKVDEMAAFIEKRLPGANGHGFKERAGGYPLGAAADRKLNYLKCLAAGMIDYADTDSVATLSEGAYRGMDAYPLVNELMVRLNVESLTTKEAVFSITTYAELWNMTNKRITGEIKIAFDYNAVLSVGFQTIQPESRLDLIEPQADKPMPEDGMLWYKPQAVTLEPNEIKVFASTTLRYRVPTTAKAANVVANEDKTSRYALKFKPATNPAAADFALVDKPLSYIERKSRTVSSGGQAISANNIAGALGAGSFEEGIGDPRAAFFIQHSTSGDNFHSAVAYDTGGSPGGRNFRANIQTQPYAGRETQPSRWPDGGHDSTRGNKPASQNTNPDAVVQAAIESDKFVQQISNAGRFYSVTELGNVFDPIMWMPTAYADTWATIPLFADLKAGASAMPHSAYCGGQTLRIGRPEHTRWRPDYTVASFAPNPANARPQDRRDCASALLDLFHCGMPFQNDVGKLTGNLVQVRGHVNINTASRDALRALFAGKIGADPAMVIASGGTVLYPARSRDADRPTGVNSAAADLFADLIVKNRPFASPSELPERLMRVTGSMADGSPKTDGVPLLGSTAGVASPTGSGTVQEWNDAAAEELFGRIFNSSTVRSRNFRIVVTGQAVRQVKSRSTGTVQTQVLATRSKIYHVFVKPIRAADGTITRQQVEVTYARPL